MRTPTETHKSPLDQAYESQVLRSCGSIGMHAASSARRMAEENSGRHFKEYYHDPLTEAHAAIPEEHWTEERGFSCRAGRGVGEAEID